MVELCGLVYLFYRVQEKIFRPLFGFYDDLAQACAK
jgi:hypothetical protein